MKITDEMRLNAEIFSDECTIRCKTVKLVNVRKVQQCIGPVADVHPINPGERAYCERAIVEGEWAVNYICIPCLDKYIREYQL